MNESKPGVIIRKNLDEHSFGVIFRALSHRRSNLKTMILMGPLPAETIAYLMNEMESLETILRDMGNPHFEI